MRSRPKQPPTPADRHETVRREIVEYLGEESMTAKEISGRVGISEREVYDHLEHIKTALHGRFEMIPATCLACGFSFSKRERLKAPGRCPVCRSERITEPGFTVR